MLVMESAPSLTSFNALYQGETLGEVKQGEDVVSAADWVKRSRKREIQMEEERLLAAQRAR